MPTWQFGHGSAGWWMVRSTERLENSFRSRTGTLRMRGKKDCYSPDIFLPVLQGFNPVLTGVDPVGHTSHKKIATPGVQERLRMVCTYWSTSRSVS